jgi:tRNA dimethylallyltransferase
VVAVGLDREPAELDERIALRVDRMWAAGFVAEVEALAADGLREGPTASRALGYAHVLASFDGALTPAEARERTVTTTRRFVRRQRSWFRRDASLTWFDAARPDLLDAVSAEITNRTIGV